MRAGPFSDETVIRLLNRRFISFHFDLSTRGYLGDPDASDWVKKHLPEFSGRSVATPPVVFVTPAGKIVAKVSNYASTKQMISTMQNVLAEHSEFNQLSAAEKKLTGTDKAEMLIDLQKMDDARKTLAGETSQQAYYLLGHLARLENQWDLVEKQFAKITEESLRDDIRMELAYRHWQANDYEKLEQSLAQIPKSSNRWTEAQYLIGLANYHQDKLEEAKKTWRELIKNSDEDRWIYRADWAFSQCNSDKKQTVFRSSSAGSTPLGRIGYMGSSHPDLKKRK